MVGLPTETSCGWPVESVVCCVKPNRRRFFPHTSWDEMICGMSPPGLAVALQPSMLEGADGAVGQAAAPVPLEPLGAVVGAGVAGTGLGLLADPQATRTEATAKSASGRSAR